MTTEDFENPTFSASAGSNNARPHSARMGERDRFAEFGEKMFGWRDYTPIPLILLLLAFSDPSVFSASLGILLVVLGEVIRVYSVAFIGSVSRTRNIKTTGDNLITGGPFKFVRNPLYVGNFLIAIGFTVFGGELWLVALTAIAFAIQYAAIVHFEERLLRQRFGSAYEDFQRHVPAWVPRRLPRPADLDVAEGVAKALRSERRTLMTIVVLLLLLNFLA